MLLKKRWEKYLSQVLKKYWKKTRDEYLQLMHKRDKHLPLINIKTIKYTIFTMHENTKNIFIYYFFFGSVYLFIFNKHKKI